jgi:transposase
MTSIQVYLGLDIAKAKIDCALTRGDKFKSKVVPNSPAGFEALDAWLSKQGVDTVHACCEATNTYWEDVATWLTDHGHQLSVVNPARIAAYAKSHLARAKTDKADAKLIARFCEREHPPLWNPPPPQERQLLALLRRLRELESMRQADANRLLTAHEAVHPHIQHHLQFLDEEITQLKKTIEEHIDNHPDLRGRRDLLDSIPGLGEATIPWLIAYLGDGTRFQRTKQTAAFAGLSPRVHQSGNSSRKVAIAKSGHAELRYVLYMPAMVAYSRCAAFAPFVARLKAAGKPPKVIIIALMRKLITIAYAIIKSGQPFNTELYKACKT